MHLPEFIMLVVTTIAAIAAGFAMVVSNYKTARVLFWIAALSFGSLGIVWSLQSDDGSGLTTKLAASFLIGGIAAAGLCWGLLELSDKENKVKSASSVETIPKMRKEDSPTVKFAPLSAESSVDSSRGSTFFKQESGSIVEGLVIDGVETRGMHTDFDIRGVLKNPKISNYKSDAAPGPFGAGYAHIDHMYIGRVSNAPKPKIGVIQPGDPLPQKKNENNTFTDIQPMSIDKGNVIDVLFAIGGSGISGFYVMKDGKDAPLVDMPSQDGRIIKIYRYATGNFELHIVKTGSANKADIGLDYRPLEILKPNPF